jgi:hypothetical protein
MALCGTQAVGPATRLPGGLADRARESPSAPEVPKDPSGPEAHRSTSSSDAVAPGPLATGRTSPLARGPVAEPSRGGRRRGIGDDVEGLADQLRAVEVACPGARPERVEYDRGGHPWSGGKSVDISAF